jgi:hypothetical protein
VVDTVKSLFWAVCCNAGCADDDVGSNHGREVRRRNIIQYNLQLKRLNPLIPWFQPATSV